MTAPGPSLPTKVRTHLDKRYAAVQRIEDYCLMYLEGKSTLAIAKVFKTSGQNVCNSLKNAGMIMRPRGVSKKVFK